MKLVNGILELEYMPQKANPERAALFEPVEKHSFDWDSFCEWMIVLGFFAAFIILAAITSVFEIPPV